MLHPKRRRLRWKETPHLLFLEYNTQGERYAEVVVDDVDELVEEVVEVEEEVDVELDVVDVVEVEDVVDDVDELLDVVVQVNWSACSESNSAIP